MKLAFGVHLSTHGLYDYGAFLKTAVLADSLGYDYITIGDHIFVVPERAGGNPDRPYKLDSYTTLTALATQTTRAKLGTRVSPLPFYNPTRLAKMLTTVDIISGGRVILGAGAGAGDGRSPENNEFFRSGIGWFTPEERIGRMRESIDVMLRLWSEDRTSFKGKYYSIPDMPFWPKPVQKPHPPIWFGGSGDRLLSTCAKYGVGIFPFPNASLDALRDLNDRLKKAEEKQGRRSHAMLTPSLVYPDGIGTASSQWPEKVEELANVGASVVMIDLSHRAVPPAEAQEFLKNFAQVFLKFKE